METDWWRDGGSQFKINSGEHKQKIRLMPGIPKLIVNSIKKKEQQ